MSSPSASKCEFRGTVPSRRLDRNSSGDALIRRGRARKHHLGDQRQMVRPHIRTDPTPRDRPVRTGQDVVDADPGQPRRVRVAVVPPGRIVADPEAGPNRREQRAVRGNVEVAADENRKLLQFIDAATSRSTS